MAGKLTGIWVRPQEKDHSVWRWAYEDEVQDQQPPARVDDEVGTEATYARAAAWSQEAPAQVRPPTERELAEFRVSPSPAEMKVLATGRTRIRTLRISNRRSTYWNNRPAGPAATLTAVTRNHTACPDLGNSSNDGGTCGNNPTP
jgi:hypothetical protein